MSAVGGSGGSGGNRQFVDTVGGYTSSEAGVDTLTITSFQGVEHAITGSPVTGRTYFQESLTDLLTGDYAIGYGPVKLFQFYKITKVQYFFVDIDYGQSYGGEIQGWHVFMAPWKMSWYVGGSTQGNTKATFLPGCVWKNFAAPTIAYTTAHTSHSSGNSQVLELTIEDPPFSLRQFDQNSGVDGGTKLEHNWLTTYSYKGVDTAQWLTMTTYWHRYSGTGTPPSPMYHQYMTKVTYMFKGLRGMLTTALGEYLIPPDLNHSKAVSVGDKYVRSKSGNNMGSDPKKREADAYAEALRRKQHRSETLQNRPQRSQSAGPSTLSLSDNI